MIVGHATHASFRDDLLDSRFGDAVQSVGATRTVTVAEGTPSAAAQAAGKESAAAPPPLDPREGEQWDMRQIKADQAHAITGGSRRVLVGVLDSGIDATHPDLAPNLDTADSVGCARVSGRPA